MAQHTSDLIWATKMTGKSEETSGGNTTKQEFGKYAKGAFNLFNPRIRDSEIGSNKPDNRLLFSIKHAGENHEVYADVRLDRWETFAKDTADPDKGSNTSGFAGIAKLLTGQTEDWWVKGNVGPINAQIGSAGYGGFVDTRADWGEWYQYGNDLNRFGVHRPKDAPNAGFRVGDDFRTWNEWGKALGLGISFGDYRVSLGHRLDPSPWWDFESNPPSYTDPAGSASSANASFIFSGRPTDAISFDVFYSVMGYDKNTFGFEEYDGTSGNPAAAVASWGNIIGAYVGINAIENLGLSIGYTATFNVYEKVGYYGSASDVGDTTKLKQRSAIAPFYSGINIHATYSGIDKIWLNFNNNISFAGVKGVDYSQYSGDKVSLKLKEIKDHDTTGATPDNQFEILSKDESQDWFHWDTRLAAKLSLIDDVGIRVIIANRLGIQTDKNAASGVDSTITTTHNELHISASAEYGIGAVTVGAGLFFQIDSKVYNAESAGGYKFKGNTDVVSFGIPILFKVAF
jgi:hypothetical protein